MNAVEWGRLRRGELIAHRQSGLVCVVESNRGTYGVLLAVLAAALDPAAWRAPTVAEVEHAVSTRERVIGDDSRSKRKRKA